MASASSAVSGSADASQLGGSFAGTVVGTGAASGSADASPLGEIQQGGSSAGTVVGTVCVLRIGSFNVGIDQNMLEGKEAGKYILKVEDIITTCVQDGGLHIMNLCELGGHKQGPLSSRFGWFQECSQIFGFRCAGLSDPKSRLSLFGSRDW